MTARGWVKTRRDSKNVHFVQLNDGSSPVDLQVVLDAGVVGEDVVAKITTGACISATSLQCPGKGSIYECRNGRWYCAYGRGGNPSQPCESGEGGAWIWTANGLERVQ